jgi:predicted dehydrogenase
MVDCIIDYNDNCERNQAMLKIGMVGAGFVAGFHERALQSVRNVELAAVIAPKGAEAG